jgi:GT2 family glycosyltransferase
VAGDGAPGAAPDATLLGDALATLLDDPAARAALARGGNGRLHWEDRARDAARVRESSGERPGRRRSCTGRTPRTPSAVENVAAEAGIATVVVDAPAAGRRAPGRTPSGGDACAAQPGIAGARTSAGGAARGARTAALNNDARLRPGAVAAALRVLATDPAIGVVGPKVLLREDPQRLWLAWGRVTWRQSLVGLCGAGAPDGPAWSAQRDVEWVAGCAMWFRAAALDAVGLLDEAFFAYHEDVDWCVSARARGFRIVFAPDARVTHRGEGSLADRGPANPARYLSARNTVLFARKHAGPRQWATLGVCLATSLPLQLLWHLPRGDAGDVWLKVRGIADAFAGRRPPLDELGLR